jgi:hypothetical protein
MKCGGEKTIDGKMYDPVKSERCGCDKFEPKN